MSSCCDKSKAPKAAESSGCSSKAEASSGSCCATKTEAAPSSCCGTKTEPLSSGCCASQPSPSATTSCCDSDSSKPDWFLRVCFILVLFLYGLNFSDQLVNVGLPIDVHWELLPALVTMAHTVHELVNTMWFSVVLAALFVGFLAKIPQAFVTSILGRGGSFRGLWRATMAGVLMDLCSHGILMVGMQLYRKGASLGQVMAFLVASPWNSLSLTLILIALVGWQWTLAFIVLSMLLALSTGYLFDRLSAVGKLPENPNLAELDEGFEFWPEAKRR
ncbi:MAG: permease, partial [Cellvibrionaceae bacterium]|nr:permease [Cellvibrionaceae bacterium]